MDLPGFRRLKPVIHPRTVDRHLLIFRLAKRAYNALIIMKVTIAVINQKGGVGKTTTTVNLAAGLARAGYSTLLVDLDPQAHATVGVGIDPDALDGQTIADILLTENRHVSEIITDTYLSNLKIAPSSILMAKADAHLQSQHFREQRLSYALEAIPDFDYILIDCQPTLGVLPVNAMVAANYFLVPTQPSGYALRGLGDLLETLHSVKRRDTPWDYRILLTMVMGQARVTNEKVREILESLHDKVLQSVIRRNEKLNRAQSDDEPRDVFAYDKSSPGAKDYEQLTQEVSHLWPRT